MDDSGFGLAPNERQYSKSFGRFTRTSEDMRAVYTQIKNYAATHAPILITGEASIGKTTCAEALHYYSDLHECPFIKVEYENELRSALAENSKATIFISHFERVSEDCQNKIKQEFSNNKFRFIFSCPPEDLTKIKNKLGLDVKTIAMKPLRSTRDDIICLLNFYLILYAKEYDCHSPLISENAENALRRYSWPQNIVEIKDLSENLITNKSGHTVSLNMLPEYIQNSAEGNEDSQRIQPKISLPLNQIEKHAIESTIVLCEGNIVKAAEILNISPSTIYRKQKIWDKL